MSQVIVILDSNTLTVSDWYFSDSPIVPVTPGIRLPVPDGLSWDTVKGVQDGDEITLVEDPAKVAQKTEAAWTSLRSQRNQLLAASDWTRLDDVSLTDEQKAQWAEYRAALRDVTKGLEDPARVQWPTRPSP